MRWIKLNDCWAKLEKSEWYICEQGTACVGPEIHRTKIRELICKEQDSQIYKSVKEWFSEWFYGYIRYISILIEVGNVVRLRL